MKEDPFAGLLGEYCIKHKAFKTEEGVCHHCELGHPEWREGVPWDQYNLEKERIVGGEEYPGWLVCMWIVSIGVSLLGFFYMLGHFE